MTEILIENNQDKIDFTDELSEVIKAVCDEALKEEKAEFDAEISVTITDNEEIRRINKEFRNKDAATDVLSFPMLEPDDEGEFCTDFECDGEYVVLGDIVISLERAAEQAQSYGHSLKREVAFLTAHSMLHLFGYDHVDDVEGESIMNEKQDRILENLNITRE